MQTHDAGELFKLLKAGKPKTQLLNPANTATMPGVTMPKHLVLGAC